MDTAPLDQLHAAADPGKAEQMARYHKAPRVYLGIGAAQINDLVKSWRATLDVDGRVALAQTLWDSDIHEARLAAAKLLTQARLRPDTAAWDLIATWVPQFDGWATADHAATAGQKRLIAEPSRLDQVAQWTTSDHMWSRRAALMMTLPWAKMNHPKPAELAVRARVLEWCASYATDHNWFIQKAIAGWLHDLSRHDCDAARAFLATHGDQMKPFARREAARHLSDGPHDLG